MSKGHGTIPARRELLIRSSSALAALAGAAIGLPVSAGSKPTQAQIDVHIELRATPDQVQIRSGKRTSVWRYQGRQLRGDAAAFEPSAGGYLGPIIRVRQGQRVRIDLVNGLPESTIIHWHGLHEKVSRCWKPASWRLSSWVHVRSGNSATTAAVR